MRADLAVLASLAGPALAAPSFERRQEKEFYTLDMANDFCHGYWDKWVPRQECVDISLECAKTPGFTHPDEVDACSGRQLLSKRYAAAAAVYAREEKAQGAKPAAEKPKETKAAEKKPAEEKPSNKKETYPIGRVNEICTKHWDRFIDHQVCVNIHLECWQKPESQYRVQADSCAGTRILRMRLDGTANKGQTKPAVGKPEEKKPAAEKPKEPKPVVEKPEEKKPVAEKPEESKPAVEKPEEPKPEEPKPAAEKPEETKPDANNPVNTPDAPQSSPELSIEAVCRAQKAGQEGFPTMKFCVHIAEVCQEGLGSDSSDWVSCLSGTMAEELQRIEAKKASKQNKGDKPQGQDKDKAQPSVQTPDNKPAPAEKPQSTPEASSEESIAAACKEFFAGRKGYPSMEFCVAAANKCQEQLGSRRDDWVPCLIRDLTDETRKPQSQAKSQAQPSVEETSSAARETASQPAQQTSAITTAATQSTSTEEPELTSTSDEFKPVQTSVASQATPINAPAMAEVTPSTTAAPTSTDGQAAQETSSLEPILSNAEESQPTQTTASSAVETTSETPKPSPTLSGLQQFHERCKISGRTKACRRAATRCAARITPDAKLEGFLDCVDSMQLCLNAGRKQEECMEVSGQCVAELKEQGQQVDYQVLKKCVMEKRPINFC
ncbi:hypothetical protein CDD80_2991 [Ophiocordyceps camponoti-rufipedis]|uniref:Extracellular membrane protein CFEM domain-containing protein n=1 Tax=Ophiocordyceps camponoti-rufipedis TaxID=2004952 RepID=A0A2C5Z5V2_9HYPO|nr:hypothetical protein CDD80_2991 [Ophiocordyceps camponoti-rufipedis]